MLRREGRVGGCPDVVVITLQAPTQGPIVAVSANVHGDECSGIAALHRLDRWLQTELVCGEVVLYPSLNPSGLSARTRTVPPEGMDLNRAFPGEPDGTAATQLASLIWRDLTRRGLSLLVDLHADSATSIPYAITDRAVALRGRKRLEMDRTLEAVASATGLTVLREYPDAEYTRFSLDKSLAGAMVNRAATPAVTIEAGPRNRISEAAVTACISAVQGILASQKMTHQSPQSATTGGPWRRASAPRTHHSGLFVPALAPGTCVAMGETLGTVHATSGQAIQILKAAEEGIVVSWTDNSWITAGGMVGTLGVREA